MVDGPVLLTGASGLLGHWLTRTVADDFEIVGIVHRRPVPGVPTVRADLLDGDAVLTAARHVRPSLIVHTAYAKDHESIVTASGHVANAAADVGADVVHISSDVVFPGDGVGRDERSTTAPTSDYGRWKAEAERVITSHSSRNSIIRISLIVSIDPDDQAVNRIRSSAARGETTMWFTDEVRQPAGAEDLARAIWRIAALDTRSGVWHLPGPERLSRHQIAERVVAALGLEPGAIGGESTPIGSDRPRHLHLLDARATREIGWAPAPVLR
jgi:dTDP-4-dehydrorhamnose reductase